MHFSGKIIPCLFRCCCLLLVLLCNVSMADQPAVASSAYFGGVGNEQVNALTTDTGGNVYITGWTRSAGLPGADATGTNLSNGLIQAQDAFVTKLDASGTVLFTRYIGAGASSFEDKEQGNSIAVDDTTGTIYIAGTLAGNVHFSGTAGAYDNCDNGNVDAFIAVLDSSGGLNYLSCFGGSAADYATDLLLNSDGSVTVVGYTQSSEATFPLKNAFQQTKNINADAFIIRLLPSGNGADDLLFASYLGGDGIDRANGVDVDTQGNLYIVGTTGSTNLSSEDTLVGLNDAFVARLNSLAGGTSGYDMPQYVRLFGANDSIANCDSGADIAVDSQNARLYLTGRFESQGAFIARMDTSGQNMTVAIVGGSSDKTGCGATTGQTIVLDSAGGGLIGGVTASADLPVVASDSGYQGDPTDGYITRFDAGLNLLYTNYLGGSSADSIQAIDRLDNGFLYLAGNTDSVDLQVTDFSIPQGGTDVLLVGLHPQVDLALDAVTVPGLLLTGGETQFDLTLINRGPDPAAAVVFELSLPTDFPGNATITQGNCAMTLSGSIACTLPGGDLAGGASATLVVGVSSPQEGLWSPVYALSSLGHEQIPDDNQGHLDLHFVDQLPPTLVITDGSAGQTPGGGGAIGYVFAILSLISLFRPRSK